MLRREAPEDYERQKREAYVRGGQNPAPAVVTFTTETAALAVNELLQGLTDYRGEGDGPGSGFAGWTGASSASAAPFRRRTVRFVRARTIGAGATWNPSWIGSADAHL